ncbi:MAG TPA: serine--tRNA ligase, partial [Actinomycetota bacterium]|nr:serine--tRNA ligase [Actinomycetota bacterium]
MLDLKAIRDDPDPARRALSRRSPDLAADLDRLIELDAERRRLTTEVEELRAEQNRASRAIGSASAEERDRQIEEVRRVSDRLKELEPSLLSVEEEVRSLLDRLPNPPHDSVPEGETDEDNQILREVGERPEFSFPPRDHVDIGTSLGVIDLERGARLSGTRFAYLLGGAAMVQFALVRYCMDRLREKGFVPVIPPVLVREEAMFGTGFLPTDEAQLYVTREDDLYLVGTSEVALAG